MVSIDTIYQRVLALTNKEQRGYVTPLEFNLLANQAQLDIFEQYFYDINQHALKDDIGTEYSDTVDGLDEKIAIFETIAPVGGGTNLPNDLYRLGMVVVLVSGTEREAERIDQKDLLNALNSQLAKPTNATPVYTRSGNLINVVGNHGLTITTGITCNYIRRPPPVEWGYNVVADKALYNAGASTHFQLHGSEETKLVIKILELAGITVNKPGLVTIASQKEAGKIQQEKA